MAIWMLMGMAFIGAGLLCVWLGLDMWESGYRRPPWAGLFLIGGVILATGAWSLGRRVVRGPDPPGRHSRY